MMMPMPKKRFLLIWNQGEAETEGSGHVLVAPGTDAAPLSSIECSPPAQTEGMNFMIVAEAAAEEATTGMSVFSEFSATMLLPGFLLCLLCKPYSARRRVL